MKDVLQLYLYRKPHQDFARDIWEKRETKSRNPEKLKKTDGKILMGFTVVPFLFPFFQIFNL